MLAGDPDVPAWMVQQQQEQQRRQQEERRAAEAARAAEHRKAQRRRADVGQVGCAEGRPGAVAWRRRGGCLPALRRQTLPGRGWLTSARCQCAAQLGAAAAASSTAGGQDEFLLDQG
jgi:hypothetical protein